jgi:hypothetical protein
MGTRMTRMTRIFADLLWVLSALIRVIRVIRVPINWGLVRRLKHRRSQGEKLDRKRLSTMAAVYTIRFLETVKKIKKRGVMTL